MIIDSVTELIGNTPVLRIPKTVHGKKNLNLFCKLEHLNAFGSIKDRVAYNLVKDELKDLNGKTILEASSGNTGKALATIAAMNNLKFKTISNRIKTPFFRDILNILNAEVEELPGKSECPDPNNPEDYMVVAMNQAKKNPEKYFYTDQYFNKKNVEAHNKTGAEILKDVEKVDYFISFLGTAGSSRGIGDVLRERCNAKLIGLVADKDNYVPGGRTFDELWEIGFFEKGYYDSIISGSVDDAIDGMLTLVRKLGLMVGPGSGLAYKKTLDFVEKLDPEEEINVVFIACDRMEPYITYLKKYRHELFKEDKSVFDDLEFEDINDVPEMSVDDLKKETDYTILDMRSPTAFQVEHLDNSINLPEFMLDELFRFGIPFSKSSKIIVLCPVGAKSRKVAAALIKKGYSAHSLAGGFMSWKQGQI